MLSRKTINIIAYFEMKTLLRSWFFRIFAGLSILFLGIFNIFVFIETTGIPWIYRALPGNIPYVNLLILNLGQSIVAIFLSSEFLKQDQKNDTIEVIYARSMTNSEYVIGKSLGILYVFLILNFIILLIGIGFSFLSSDSQKDIGVYFLYPLLISIPTLIFILGLSFSLMLLFKNQAITFIVLLGYIALTIFYLNHKFYHIFDYVAYKIPMMYSGITGFGDFKEIFIHRSLYFCLGVGLIFLTAFKLNRLPQSKKLTSFPLFLCIIFLTFGGFLINKYIDIKKNNIEFKKQMIVLNNQYANIPKVKVLENHLTLSHIRKKIHVISELDIQNDSGESIDTLIFNLNPSLKILSVKIDNKPINFIRNLQIIQLIPSSSIINFALHKIKIEYDGGIDERTHFLDLDIENFETDFSLDNIFRVRKRFAFLTKNFVCLTRESLWYPTSGVTYNTKTPAYFSPDFTKFTLKVKTQKNFMAISQGSQISDNMGNFTFQPDYPLTQISLLIGNYNKYSTTLDSIEYGIFTIKGNAFFERHFTDILDSLPGIIRDLKNEYETTIGFEYPFKRFNLAEVPIHFALDKHIYSISSDAVQPEIMYYPEKGITLEDTDFSSLKKRFERRMKRDNEEITPEDIQTRIFKRFVRGNYMANQREWYQFNKIIDRNTFSIFPNYYNFVTQFNNKDWPILDLSLGIYLKDRNENVDQIRWFFTNIIKSERINLELKNASLKDLMKNGIQTIDKDLDDNETVKISDIIHAKGYHLFNLFRTRYGNEEFNSALNRFIKDHYHQSFSLNDFTEIFKTKFNNHVEEEIANWFETKQIPGFLIKDMELYKVMDGDFTKFQIKFKISNPKPVDGWITFIADLKYLEVRNEDNQTLPDFTKNIYIPSQQSKEIGFVFNNEPNRVSILTHISENLPNSLVYDFDNSEDVKKIDGFDGEKNCEFFSDVKDDNAIIVDNEDENFTFQQDLQKSYLKSLVDKNRNEGYKYKGVRWWKPPFEWIPVVRSGFYGKYVRSAYYTHSGDGDRTARWQANIKESAYFDIYCHIEKINYFSRRSRQRNSFNFKIHHQDGIEDITLLDKDVENGWNYMGTFFITPETSIVEITNKSRGNLTTADAIKWVRN